MVLPLRELPREEAVGLDRYLEQPGEPPERYLVYDRGELARVVYLRVVDAAAAFADFRARQDGVPGEVYGRVALIGRKRFRYRTWYLKPSGELAGLKDYDVNAKGNYRRETWLTEDGRRIGWRTWKHDSAGELLEVLTYDAEGRVVSREDP